MAAPVTAVIGLGKLVGVAVARRFNEAGHKLAIADTDTALVEKVLTDLPDGSAFYNGDLHTTLGLRNCLSATMEAYGRVDHVVCIPHIPEPAALLDMEMERFDKSLAQTTRGAILALRIFSEQFKQQMDAPHIGVDRVRQNGTVTFILNLSGLLAHPGQFNESVTQNALLGVMRAGAVELASLSIRCNAVTALRPRSEDQEPWIKSRTPLGRAALADEIADAALYLAQPNSAIITGQTLTLDGGRTVLGGLLET